RNRPRAFVMPHARCHLFEPIGVALIDNEIPSDQARSAANRSPNSNGSGHSREVNFFSSQWTLERRGKSWRNCRFADRSRVRGTACWKRIVGKCTRAAEYLIAINQGIIDRLLDVVRFQSAR